MKFLTTSLRLYIVIPDAGVDDETRAALVALVERASDRLQEAVDAVKPGALLSINGIDTLDERRANEVPLWAREIARDQYIEPREG